VLNELIRHIMLIFKFMYIASGL